MDPKRIVALVVGASVMVLIFSALLVPIINDATTTEKTFENEGYFYMQKISASDAETYTFEYTYADGVTTITLNDEPINVGTTNPVTLATNGSDWFVRYGQNNEYIGLQILGTELIFGGYSTTPMTVELANGTVTATGYVGGSETPTVYTKTYTEAYIYTPEKSDYVMKKADAVAYLHEDSEYIAMGQTTIKEWYDSLKIIGTVEDFTVDILVPEEDLTVTNKVIDANAVNGYDDLYALSKLTFTASYDEASTNATYSYFIVPAEVTADITVTPDAGTRALLSAIPIIAMIGIVLAVVSVAIVGRNDY